jgi:ABC-type branched-subunit amino acid transport system substrate-binding protein
MKNRGVWKVAVWATALTCACTATGCSSKADEASGGEPGVTSSSIKLGVLVDLSGAFSAGGKATLQGIKIFWDRANEQGGVCDRKVELVVEDHGYNTQTAVNQYTSTEPDVLAFQMLLGSPMTSALLPRISEDEVLTIPSSFASSLLENPYIALTGTTYDKEMSNGIHWLVDHGELKAGDKIGHIYLQGDFGETALAGTRAAADELGLKVVTQEVQPSDKDMTAQVATMKQQGVDHIMLTTTPVQTLSAASVAAASGFDAKFVGSSFTFIPSLLDGAGGSSLVDSLYVTSTLAPLSSDEPGPTQLRTSYQDQYGDESPNQALVQGTAAASVMHSVLESACENGEVTRSAVFDAFQHLAAVDTKGLVPTLDFSKSGEAPTETSFMSRPDPDALGGLRLVQ